MKRSQFTWIGIISFFCLCHFQISAQNPELVLQVGHMGDINEISFSPDGKYIVTASEDKTAKIWEVKSGKLFRTLEGHTNSVFSAVFSPDSKNVETISKDNTVKTWDIATGQIIGSFEGKISFDVAKPLFSPDRKNILMVSDDDKADSINNDSTFKSYIRVFNIRDVRTGDIIQSIKGHINDFLSCSFSPDGNYLMTMSDDGSSRIWNVRNGELLHVLPGTSANSDMASWMAGNVFSSDSRKLLTIGFDMAVKIWDCYTGKLLCKLKGHPEEIVAVDFTGDGKMLAALCSDNTVFLWDARSGKLLNRIIEKGEGFSSVKFIPDGKNLLISSKIHGYSLIQDIQSGQILFSIDGGDPNAFSPDGKSIVTTSNIRLVLASSIQDGIPKLWDVQTGRLIHKLKGATSYVSLARFSPDGQNVMTDSWDWTAKIWDLKNGKLKNNLSGHGQNVESIQCSPDGSKVLTESYDKTSKVWDLSTGKLLFTIKGRRLSNDNPKPFSFVSFSPDSKIVAASMTYSDTVSLFDAETGGIIHYLKAPDQVVGGRFNPDGTMIVVESKGAATTAWDVQSGNLLYSLEAYKYESIDNPDFRKTKPALFSPDGNNVVTFPEERMAEIWNVADGELVFTIDSIDKFPDAPFSPDSKYIAVIANRNTDYDPLLFLEIRDVNSGKLIRSIDFCLYCGNIAIPRLFSFDSKMIIIPEMNGTIHLVDFQNGKILHSFEFDSFGMINPVDEVRFSPGNDKLLIEVNNQKEIRVLDIGTGKVLKSMNTRNTNYPGAKFSPDGSYFITLNDDGDAEIWDSQSLERLQKLGWHFGKTNETDLLLSYEEFTFSNDGRRIQTIQDYQNTRIWDVQSGKLLDSHTRQENLTSTGSLSPDGTKIVFKDNAGGTKIWDLEKKTWLPEPEISDSWILQQQFSPDGRTLLISIDSTIKLFDVQTGSLLLTLMGASDNSNPAVFSPDGQKIMLTTGMGLTRIWNSQDGKLLSTLDSIPMFNDKQSTANSGEVQSGPVIFSPDGQKIVIEPYVWNAADGSLLHHLPVEQFSSLGAPLSPDSKKMVMNFTDESQKIRAKSWDVQNGKLLQNLSWRAGDQYYGSQQIQNVQFSLDGRRIITTALNDSIIRVWDFDAGELIFSISCDEGKPAFAYFSSDGKNIISWMNNGTIKTWNIQSRELIKSESWPETLIEPFFYGFISSNDVKMLASFSDNGDVGIWDIQGRRFFHKLEGGLKNISFASFSPDGTKIMAEASFNDTLRMWNVQNGDILYNLNANEEGLNDYANGLGSLLFSPDGNKIIASRNNIIKIWDPESAQLLHSLNGPSGFSPSITNLSVTVSQDSRLIMAFTYDNDTVKVWDLQSGKLLFCQDVIEEKKKVENNDAEPAFIPQEGIKSALFSDDGKSIRTITTTGEVKIWNALNGKLFQSGKTKDQSNEPAGLVSVDSPDLTKKVSFLWDGTALLWILVDGQWTLILSMEGNFSPVISAKFHPDNNQLFVAYADSSSKIWDVQTGEMLYALERQSGFVTASRFSPDGMNLFTFLSDSTAKIWDIQTGKWKNTLEGKVGKVGSVSFSSDNRKLLVTNTIDNSAKIWDTENGKLLIRIEGVFWKTDGEEEEESDKTGREVTFTSDGTKIISASLKPPDFKQMSTTLWDVESGQALHSLDGFVVNATDNFKIPFSPDSKKLVTASEGGITKIWNVQTGKLLHSLDPQDGIREVNATVFSPDGKSILVSSYKFKTKDRLISGYPVDIWDSGNGQLLRSIDFKLAKLQDICWSGSKLIYTYNTAISLYDLKSGKEIVTFVSINKDDYVFILPSGEYSGTPEGIKNLVWRLGDKLYNVNQWDLQYNRPDKVLEQLGNPDTALIRMYRKAYQKRLKRAGFTEEMFSTERHTPGIKIVNNDALAYNTDKAQVQLEICGTDSKYKIDRFNVWINDVPIFGSRGMSLIRENTDSINKIINVPLSDGKNEINVSCINEKGVESLKESVNIIYHPKIPVKPDLYVIAMSVSRYKDTRYNLQYAVKDGRDIASIFRSLAIPEGYFGNIIIDTLFNERATRENFFNLKQKLSASNVDDQVVVFVSGHGLLDRDIDFYFASFDVDFSQPEKRGISFDDLEALLDSIPARKKLMLMDACHSGEVDKEERTELMANNMQPSSDITFRGNIKEYNFKGVNNKMVQSGTSLNSSFELMQELFTNLDHGTGTTVISAAAGKGYALESPQWNNGVFTYSIINGLMNKAADSNNDKQITVSELKDYSINQVQQLTGGKQKPTTRKESLAVDWRVW